MKLKAAASRKPSSVSATCPSFALICAALILFCSCSNKAVAQSPVTLPDAPLPVALSAPLQPGEAGFVPMTSGERSALFFRGYLGSPVMYYEAAAVAAGQLIVGEPEGWPRTVSGYAKRSGSQVALLAVEEGIHEGGDALLGLDPRYYHCRCSGVWHRTGHALKMTFVAYDANGNLHPDLPRLVGDYGGAMLVTTWYPSQYIARVQGVQMGHAQVGFDAGINILREFSPELKRLFRRVKAE
jgi:hypothetical protein